MSGILIGEWFAGTSHNDYGFFGGVSEELVHADIGFFDDDAAGDGISFVVVDDFLRSLELIEFLEDG